MVSYKSLSNSYDALAAKAKLEKLNVSEYTSKLPSAKELPDIFRSYLTKGRLLYLTIAGIVSWLLLSSISTGRSHADKFHCFGPAMTPFEMNVNSYSDWHRNSPTPVEFNTHKPLSIKEKNNSSSITLHNLNTIVSTKDAINNRERVLILTPLRDASRYLSKYFELLMALSYPHDLIDLGFLISDTSDETLAILSSEIANIQSGSNPFNHVDIFQKDFGYNALDNVDVQERHKFEHQAPRRKNMARARNYLLSSALKPTHSWVMWRDVDIVECADTIIEDLVKHDTDIIVPNIWFHRYVDGRDIEGRFDYNSWVESQKGLKLAASLSKDDVIVEGYKTHYDTGRNYLARMGDWRYNNDEEIELDGVGGVNIVVKADVHRSGVIFPSMPFENQVETEGFAKMAKRAGYRVIGLPNYVVWHIDTDEKSNH
ncbi:Anp1p [Sugiyamaella lignohabitans]|uniref:Anp1p n=1 Tax=Sugiyamaella lignohabitans TaxID=796027 RepID=A0A167FI69_9ASCO|nr:Anp1p [Sugiyamaella lignohabitans]ANB15331.1 Anp1p [Sugiyamaella lignohabitans]